MHPEIKENYRELLRLAYQEQISKLDENFQAMLRLHSAKGRLGSGDTIKRTMEFISEGNNRLYQAVLDHLQTLNLEYYPTLEKDFLELVGPSQQLFKTEALSYFRKSTEHAKNPQLYDRLLPDLESDMAKELAKFQNSLNAATLQMKQSSQMTPLVKLLWGVEAALLLISMFIAGMWFKDPAGNYEPVLVALGFAVPLMVVVIKYCEKKKT